VPVKALKFSDIDAQWEIKLQFSRLTTRTVKDEWNPSCEVSVVFAFVIIHPANRVVQHQQEGERGEGKGQEWTTEFSMMGDSFIPKCDFCCQRLERQIES
jgi:hypothetical protein